MLTIIPTPIWNKEDITLRALRLINELTWFFCEDTTTTKKLMKMYDIDYKLSNKQLYTFNSFLSDRQREKYIEIIKNEHVWLLCEAGTPGLSDPAKELIRQCRIHDINFEILPWATALIPAVIWSNRDTTQFAFFGFLPKKKWKQTMMKKIIHSDYPIYIYESVHRVDKTLKEMKDLWFVWQVMICRELSKLHEQYSFWTIDELLKKIVDNLIPLKWEFVLWFNPWKDK